MRGLRAPRLAKPTPAIGTNPLNASAPKSGDLKVPLRSEEVAVTRREVAGETVRVSTVTREHEHRIDEDLTHTRVEIERVPIGRPIDTAPPVREEGDTTILSVVEEVIVIRRQLVLKEEVRIRRVQVAERYQDNVTVRQQDISVTRIEAPTTAGGNAPPTVDTIHGS